MRTKTRVIALLLPILSSCGPEPRESDFDRFTGRWSLYVVEQQTDSLGPWEPRQDHYKGRKGFLIYDGRGGMGVHHVPATYETYRMEGKGGLNGMTTNDLRHLANNFVYFGKYRVNDSLKRIEHLIESADYPKSWGTVAQRTYSFSGDTLTLYPVTKTFPKSRLRWIKLNDLEP